MALDNTRFLSQVTIKAALPTGRFTNQEILDVAYDVLLSDVVPFLISLRQEFFTAKSPQTIVAGTKTYAINARALGNVLRELKWADLTGKIFNLTQIDPSDVNDDPSGTPQSFYMQANSVILYPTPIAGGTLYQTYFERPSRPVEISTCAQITAIDTVNGIVTATPYSTWTTANSFDFVSANQIRAKDVTASSIGTSTMTFGASNIPYNLAVGDYVALAQETPFVTVPDDCIPLLQQLTAVDLLESMGDANAVQLAISKAEKLRSGLARIMSIRVEGEPVKLTPTV